MGEEFNLLAALPQELLQAVALQCTTKSKLLLSTIFKKELESIKPHWQWRKLIMNGDIE